MKRGSFPLPSADPTVLKCLYNTKSRRLLGREGKRAGFQVLQKLAKTAGHLPVTGRGFIFADVYTDFSLKSVECNQEILKKFGFLKFSFLEFRLFKGFWNVWEGQEGWDFILLVLLLN